MKKKVMASLMALAVVVGLTAEGASSEAVKSGEGTTVTIAGTAVSQVFYEAFKDLYESLGYKTKFILFDSNPVCLEACATGETMVSIGQQLKFVHSYNTNNGTNLEMVKPYGMYTGIGFYSEKYDSVDKIPDARASYCRGKVTFFAQCGKMVLHRFYRNAKMHTRFSDGRRTGIFFGKKSYKAEHFLLSACQLFHIKFYSSSNLFSNNALSASIA